MGSGSAFSNQYWPAVYIADAEGRIRHHHFGEGGYEECERVIQQLLREAGGDAIRDDLVSVVPRRLRGASRLGEPGSPETYLGYQQGLNFASPGGAELDEARTYAAPGSAEAQLSGRSPGTGRSGGGRAC